MSDWTDSRPMSPHLWSWRWHITMAASILHRLTGFANIAGFFLFAGWILALSGGSVLYAGYRIWAGSWYVQAVLLVCSIGLVFHLLNGVRYLFWDVGRGFNPSFASFVSLLNMLLALLGGGVLWYLFCWL